MTERNTRLAVVALALLVLSAFTYWRDVSRAERFERGQKFLSNLNPDEIGKISIRKGTADDAETVTLERNAGTFGKDEFTLSEKNGYKVKNEAVNRFVRALLDLELDKEVGRGEKLAEELGIEPAKEETIAVEIQNQAGQPMVSVRIGDRQEEGSGRYVRRLDLENQPIFLTSSSPNLDTAASSYLRKEIVDAEASDVLLIEGPDFVIEREGLAAEAPVDDEGNEVQPSRGALKLVDVPSGKSEKTSEIEKAASAFSRLQFDEVFVADDPEVADLEWRRGLRVSLDDQSGYAVMVAEKDERIFARITAFLGVDRIEVTREETDDELKEKSKVLKRSDEVQQFNSWHGSWVYELTEFVGSKLLLTKDDLVE